MGSGKLWALQTKTHIKPDTPSLEIPGVMHYRPLPEIVMYMCSGTLHGDI